MPVVCHFSVIRDLSRKFGNNNLFQHRFVFENLCACSAYAPSYKRTVDVAEINQPIYKYVGKHRKRQYRTHVCGLTVTGALGVLKLPLPEKKLRIRRKIQQLHPYRLMINDIETIACGYGYSIFSNRLTDHIKIWGCGVNTNSQLGFHKDQSIELKQQGIYNELYQYVMVPMPIPLPMENPNDTRVTDVACGRAHTVILTDKEGVFTLGNNAFGQCGRPIVDGEIYQSSAKVHRIPHEHFPSPVKKVVCGMDHTLFLTEDGQVFACGWSADGQTGLGTLKPICEPSQLKGDLDGVNVKQISSFADTSLTLSHSNDVFGWGSSEYGQLACVNQSTQTILPTKLPFTNQKTITQVAAGGTACLLLNENGEVWVWGYGILGKGPNLNSATWPRRIPTNLFRLSQLDTNVQVTRIKCGLGSFAAITNTGELYTWGKNRSGCLGIGSHRDRFFPWRALVGSEVTDVACGADHMITQSKSML